MKTRQYFLKNLNCPTCAVKIENEIKDLNFVEDAIIDIFNQRILVRSEKDIFPKVREIVKLYEKDADVLEIAEKNSFKYTDIIILSAVYIFLLIAFNVIHYESLRILFNLCFILFYFYTGKNVLLSAVSNLKRGYVFDENFLMSIATVTAILIGAFEEAAGVMVFYRIGEILEGKAIENSKDAIYESLKFVSNVAHRIEGESFVDIKPEGVKKGDILLVKSGEMVPVEGVLLSDEAEFDQSSITGESLPIVVKKGEIVYSGSSPVNSSVKIKALCDFYDAKISQLVELISNAPQNKSEKERFITKFSAIYTPIVVCLAVLIVFVPYIFSAAGFFHTSYTFKDYLYRGLVFLVVSCPCALMLSVPLSFFVNIGRAAKKGIVVKGSVFLEAFKKCKYILFDKTGTLTEGSFKIVDIKPQKGYTKEYVLNVATSLEAYSNHPIAKAFKNKTQKYNFKNILELPGRGIKGEKGGDIFYVGNRRLLTELKINYHDAEVVDSALKLYLVINRDIAGEIYLNDQLKDDAEETIIKLRRLGFIPVILSGDSEALVKKVADKLGVKEYYHSLLPEEKLEILLSYKNKADKIAAVGDGLNDTAIISYADVGIAMGKTAASLSIEVADVVVIGSKLKKLCDLYSLSKSATKLSFENIAIALTIKVLVMGFALFGLSSLWAAIFADVGAALLVVLNSIKQIVIKSDIV